MISFGLIFFYYWVILFSIIGYGNFNFEVLEEVQFSDRTELYDVEDTYILKYDSISNGWNTRRNTKHDL